MSEPATSLPRLSPTVAWLLLLAGLLPFFVRPSGPSVWDANEAFYVETPREMVESGVWLVPTFNGRPRLNKPPLAYWPVALLYKALGVDLVWERLLMALLASGCVLLTFQIGRRLWQETAPALLAALVFATTFRLFILARRLLIDVLLLFLVLAALYFMLDWLRTRRWQPATIASLFLGLAFLAKGPVAVLPLAALILHLTLSRRLRELFTWGWVAGGAVFVAVSGSWFVALGLFEGWEPVKTFLFTENVGRYLATDFGPRRGYLYYVGVFAADSFPWSLLFPAAAVASIRKIREARDEHEPELFLFIWWLVYILFFSASLNKQEYYIAPVYAPASLLIAGWAHSGLRARATAWLAAAALALVAILLLPAAFILFPDTLFWVPPVCLFLGAWFAWKRRWIAQGLALAAFLALGALVYLPALEAYRPVRPFADTISATASSAGLRDWRAGYFLVTAPSLRFYLDRDISELFEAAEAVELLRDPRPAFLITNQAGYEMLSGTLPAEGLHIIERRPILRTTGRRFWAALRHRQPGVLQENLLLLSNRPFPAPSPIPKD